MACGLQLPSHVPLRLIVFGDGVAVRWPLGPLSIVPLECTDPPMTVTSPLPSPLIPVPSRQSPHERADPGVSAVRALAEIRISVVPASTPNAVSTLRTGTTTLPLVGCSGFAVVRVSSVNEMQGDDDGGT